ncbi:ribonuclease E activity regulator RraA [Roseibium porphyridii]|uniref:4-hydroxy-4-methyl-2-oxoglutarate aldolase n=1 Tax=Roseibium porphyridii TaxID=2866279 RepID=A0ABY8F7R4_9HYPH|nr:ribonuclease E activity regulator RraA [Roseibium sp. KMA01]WFE91543.1 ribonuclease E activity regulator RraA [Roseibium sp. KMA01]
MSEALAFFATCDLNDAYPEKVTFVQLPFRDFARKRRFSGRIRTAVMVDDTKLVQEALFSQPGNGAIIVLDGGGSNRTALLGDRMAERLIQNDWAGIIVNGAVRDSHRLADLEIGVKALGTSPVRSGKTGKGAIDVPVAFGGAFFEPGKCLYCDEDGVLISDEPLQL